ncbi:MAG TPA: rhomboid family intramembrane serine protease [Flavobacteriales bacterium]|nr:rhomboid family intramembrane serine protease [Flavobacteriales bacterium]
MLLLILAVTVGASLFAMKKPQILDKLMLVPYNVNHFKEYYRIVSHGFIHADGTHLFFNMFVLWEFGKTVEAEMGASFPVLYFGALLTAAIPALTKHKDNVNYRSLGASGAVSAVLMAFIVAHPTHTLLLFFIIPMPAIFAGVLFFLYERHMQKNGGTGIAHDAHIYGALFGLLFSVVKDPSSIGRMLSAIIQLF